MLEKNIRGRVGKGEKKNKKNENFSLRSMEFRRLEFVGPRTKVHLLHEGYVCLPKTRDFSKNSSDEFGKLNVSGLGSAYGTFESFFYGTRDSSYFGLFSILRVVWLSFNALSGCLALFSLRGCLAN